VGQSSRDICASPIAPRDDVTPHILLEMNA
jgi:hypothetical protein